jgi:hypothetical protein
MDLVRFEHGVSGTSSASTMTIAVVCRFARASPTPATDPAAHLARQPWVSLPLSVDIHLNVLNNSYNLMYL